MDSGEGKGCPPLEPVEPFVSVIEDGFGFITDDRGNRQIVRRYTFTNQNQLTVQIITYGGIITSIKYPDKNGAVDDIALGFDNIEGYLSKVNPYFGALIGRCANRIAKGHFKINDRHYQLSTNKGENHLHGGIKGFDKVLWKSDLQGNKLVLSYMSQDGEEGYPGEVLVSAFYELTTDNELILEMKATSSKPTPINLTNHTYFNLAGHGAGAPALYDHLVTINADKYTDTDSNSIPTGELKNVGGTMWDFRISRRLGDSILFIPGGGYDQNMCIHKTCSEDQTFVARVVHPKTGRGLEVYSNQPGVQFYTSNYFPTHEVWEQEAKKDLKDTEIKGKLGFRYYKHQAFCLETQNYPDAVNHKNFPNCIVKPGETYHHIVTYKFFVHQEVNLERKASEVKEPGSTESMGEYAGEAAEETASGTALDENDDLLDPKLEENGR